MVKGGVVFVIFGSTGDLTKRKLIPAIYRLVNAGNLKDFKIVGVARKPLTPKTLISASKKFISEPKHAVLNKLIKSTTYLQIDFAKESDYEKLDSELNRLEKQGYRNNIFHLATSSEFYDEISDNISRLKMAKGPGWARLVFEKPFGSNLATARKINKELRKNFKENQIYRIDHYLGKELVGNIALVRFTNRILEPLWNKNNIEQVQIILDEEVGAESRGGYLDKYGVLKDMVQSHALQLLALIAMESPKNLSGESIREEKAKVLRKVKIKDSLFAQYQGYRSEPKVSRSSKTDTFIALRAEINNDRWRGVPFFIKTGKALGEKKSLINIKFKKVECLLSKYCPSDTNYLTIELAPEERIRFEIFSKVIGRVDQVMPITMDFCHSCLAGPNTPEAYENLYLDIINGDQSVFIRNDEIEAAWEIIDSIKKGRIYTYKKGSEGPSELKVFNKRNKVRWKQ